MLLSGAIVDRDDHGIVSFVEGQRRLWERWRLEIELRLLDDVEDRVLQRLESHSLLMLRLAWLFQPHDRIADDARQRLRCWGSLDVEYRGPLVGYLSDSCRRSRRARVNANRPHSRSGASCDGS
jgi:hypothetical protein